MKPSASPNPAGGSDALGSLARSPRAFQSGYLYWYALGMIVGVIGLMTWQLWPYLHSLLSVAH